MTTSASIVWLRRDLRLADNPALRAAARRGGPVLPVFIWAPQEEGPWAPGGASRWWLHHSLASLERDLRKAGSRLLILAGESRECLASLVESTGAGAVYWNRLYDPLLVARDTAIKTELAGTGVEVHSSNASLLHEPWEIETTSGEPYKVFTPFWKACLAGEPPGRPLPRVARLAAPSRWPDAAALDSLRLLPKIDWTSGLEERWSPGEAAARRRLDAFRADALANYAGDRNRPDLPGTSGLSPHLHFGEIGPRQVWHAVRSAQEEVSSSAFRRNADVFLSEIGWREFSYHLLFHFPSTPERPLREAFERFPWRSDRTALRAWQRGRTGFPIVDAGMRELWATGWMHNRVRMIVASFLVKDLLIPWQKGAEWFWDTLVDADLANNTQGWQWTAGCGADAAPYFRVFNPMTQGKKFDPRGEYVRQWVPEIAELPDRYLQAPWEAPDDVLEASGVRLGRHYPRPIVDHAAARRRALDAWEQIRSG